MYSFSPKIHECSVLTEDINMGRTEAGYPLFSRHGSVLFLKVRSHFSKKYTAIGCIFEKSSDIDFQFGKSLCFCIDKTIVPMHKMQPIFLQQMQYRQDTCSFIWFFIFWKSFLSLHLSTYSEKDRMQSFPEWFNSFIKFSIGTSSDPGFKNMAVTYKKSCFQIESR